MSMPQWFITARNVLLGDSHMSPYMPLAAETPDEKTMRLMGDPAQGHGKYPELLRVANSLVNPNAVSN
jgi:hypothetical protein